MADIYRAALVQIVRIIIYTKVKSTTDKRVLEIALDALREGRNASS